MVTPHLFVYKASAGSGKTYTLVREYLRLLLQTGDLLRFKRIVAMTFTNKAALEMKERVIENLHRLAEGGEKNQALIDDYAANFGIEKSELTNRAKKALSYLLHNYSELNVLTIDTFNVRLMRSFIRDMNLSHDFEVIVDTDEFNERVVDLFLDSIQKGKNDFQEQIVVHFVESKLERGENWSFKAEIIDTLKLLEKEKNRVFIPSLLNYNFSFNRLKEIRDQIAAIEEEFEDFKKNILTPFLLRKDQKALEEVFSQKIPRFGNLYNALIGIQTKRFSDFKLTESSLEKIEKVKEQEKNQTVTELWSLCEQLLYFFNVQMPQYRSFDLALKSFPKLAMIRFLIQQIEEQQKQENMLQLSEVNGLIAQHIASEDTAYIYEKIGVRFDHFLLDEFQDTSEMQWSNLIPLVHNAMSQGQMNLIVGDSKQAIYRFRNGVVEQFAKLPQLYNPKEDPKRALLSAYFSENSRNEALKDNYRSTRDVIHFNNVLFQDLREFLPEEYWAYYGDEDLIQNSKSSSFGFVKLQLFAKSSPRSKSNEENDEESEDETLSEECTVFMLETIKDALSRGYTPGDICILSRNNKALKDWSTVLLNQGFPISTDEGLRVSNSMNVALLVQWFRLLSKPNSLEFRRNFMLLYFQIFEPEKQEQWLSYFAGKQVRFDAFIEDKFNQIPVKKLQYENLYDLTQKMIKILKFNELEDSYVHFFSNMVFTFDVKYGPSIERFLSYYDKKGNGRTLPLSDDNAIRLMTTHKSKGLEFPIVIIPEANWDATPKSMNTLLFYDEDQDLFYLGKTKKDTGTRLELEAYQQELKEGILDTMNLFYVACTRAAQELYINCSYGVDSKMNVKKFSESPKMGLALYELIHSKYADKIQETTEGTLKLCFGAPTEKLTRTEKTGERITLNVDRETLWFPDIALIDQESLEDMEIDQERLFGRNVHMVLEQMLRPEDLSIALEEVGKTQFWTIEYASKIKAHIERILENEKIISLIFPSSDQGEIAYNEREIVVDKNLKVRPDRLIVQGSTLRVIEFKTGQPRPRDRKQLRQYAEALRQMEFSVVEAYLIYTDRLEVERLD